MWLRTVWSEFIGLFVDDGRFALAIVVWLLASWLLLPHLPPTIAPLILFLGLAAILLESALHRSRTGK